MMQLCLRSGGLDSRPPPQLREGSGSGNLMKFTFWVSKQCASSLFTLVFCIPLGKVHFCEFFLHFFDFKWFFWPANLHCRIQQVQKRLEGYFLIFCFFLMHWKLQGSCWVLCCQWGCICSLPGDDCSGVGERRSPTRHRHRPSA